jgi:hypothetical protein
MDGRPRQGRDYEHRFPAAVAIVVGVALYAALPSDLTIGSRFVIPGLELALLVPVLAFNPHRLERQTTIGGRLRGSRPAPTPRPSVPMGSPCGGYRRSGPSTSAPRWRRGTPPERRWP